MNIALRRDNIHIAESQFSSIDREISCKILYFESRMLNKTKVTDMSINNTAPQRQVIHLARDILYMHIVIVDPILRLAMLAALDDKVKIA